jgi:nucleoside-diphosphate-sugar epimerase
MRVLVIGGTVFIGRALVNELISAGHEVCVLHRGNHEPADLPTTPHLHVDRGEIASVAGDIDAFGPDVVCDNISLFSSHARAVVEALGERRYVVTSSMDVYRAYGALQAGTASEPVPIDEASPVREERYPYRGQMPGMDDYDKLDVEDVYLAHGATVLRLPMVYGPYDVQRREELVLARVRAGRARIPIGPGSWLGTRGFVYDIARGIRMAAEAPQTQGEIFNLGESRTYPIGHWAQMILDAAGSPAELVRVPSAMLPPDLGITGDITQHLLVDSSKAQEMLGWRDSDHRQALAASVSWHLTNPPEQTMTDFTADEEALGAAG